MARVALATWEWEGLGLRAQCSHDLLLDKGGFALGGLRPLRCGRGASSWGSALPWGLLPVCRDDELSLLSVGLREWGLSYSTESSSLLSSVPAGAGDVSATSARPAPVVGSATGSSFTWARLAWCECTEAARFAGGFA